MAEKKASAKVEHPDTPSGKALEVVGGVPADDASDDAKAKAAEKYATEKAKHRWG